MKTELTEKQKAFVREYLIDLNGTQAYVRAGYAVTSERSAEACASELLSNPIVRNEVDRRIAQREKRCEVQADRVLLELARLAFVDPVALYDDDGNLRPVREMDEDTRRAIANIEVREKYKGKGETRELVSRVTKVRFHDKGRAIQDCMQHLGLIKRESESAVGADHLMQTVAKLVLDRMLKGEGEESPQPRPVELLVGSPGAGS